MYSLVRVQHNIKDDASIQSGKRGRDSFRLDILTLALKDFLDSVSANDQQEQKKAYRQARHAQFMSVNPDILNDDGVRSSIVANFREHSVETSKMDVCIENLKHSPVKEDVYSKDNVYSLLIQSLLML